MGRKPSRLPQRGPIWPRCQHFVVNGETLEAKQCGTLVMDGGRFCAAHKEVLIEKKVSAKERMLIDKENLHMLAPKAIKKLEELLECPDPRVQYAAAKDILDRVGYSPKYISDDSGVIDHAAIIAERRQRAQLQFASAQLNAPDQENGRVIDVQPSQAVN